MTTRDRSPFVHSGSGSKRNTLPAGADRLPRDSASPWYLRSVQAPAPADVFTLTTAHTSVGRDGGAGAEIVLSDPAVSRVHARFTASPGQDTLWLSDCDSTNGVLLNGRRVHAAAVRAGDVIRLGDSVLVVGRRAPGPAEEACDLDILGRSPSIVELRAMVRKVAPSALPVLVVGPTGTGKELVARAVHAESGRRGRLVTVNCAALPGTLVESALFGHRKGAYTGADADEDGAFRDAQGGTLFLDEIGDLALDAQPKLLRALENGEVMPVGSTHALAVDVRVVAATHVPLDAALSEGRFRHDLYARLAGVVVKTPALADRREDIPLLLAAFLGERGARPMSADFVESLLVYGWPFNVRELRKLAERLTILYGDAARYERGMLDEEMLAAPDVEADDESGKAARHGTTPPAPREGPPARADLIALLEECQGNVSRAAERVRRNRKQIYRWMKQHAIEPGTGRRE